MIPPKIYRFVAEEGDPAHAAAPHGEPPRAARRSGRAGHAAAARVVCGRLRRWMEGRWAFHGLRRERDVYRVVALCAIRDAQREVLRTQNLEAGEEEEEAARRELNWAYDTFVRCRPPSPQASAKGIRLAGPPSSIS